MLRAARLFADAGIGRRKMADGTRWNKNQFTAALLRGRLPVIEPNRTHFKAYIEGLVRANSDCLTWLSARKLDVTAIWDNIPDEKIKSAASGGYRMGVTAILGDPLSIKIKEGEMINIKAMKYFRLFSSPFACELRSAKDIYQGEEHIFLREMMLETARNAGFCAIVGECGCGKSVMRKTVAMKLASEGIKVVFPVIVDKSRISPVSLIDAIIMDISEEHPKRSLEAKTRQAHRLLKNRAASGMKQVLMIEEAHLLSVHAIKCLKQIHELEEGFSKLIGIILIGQPELKYSLDETLHPELREVIRRCTVAEITDLGAETGAYLKHKFDRVAAGRFDDIFAPDVIDALKQRLPGKAYPLSVNNLVARAMNQAADMGEQRVTADIILAA